MENTTFHQISEVTIQERLANGYNLDIGSYISSGWKIFSKEWLTFSLYGLISLFILMTGLGALFSYPLMLGFVLGADKVAKGEPLSLTYMFEGFNKNLGKLILLSLAPMVIIMVMYLPMLGVIFGSQLIGGESDMAMLAVSGSLIFVLLLMFVAAILLGLALFFAPFLVYFGDYTVMNALKTSWKLSVKNVLMIFVFMFLISIIVQAGIMLCLIGVFVSYAFGYVCYYPLIKDVLFNEKITFNPHSPIEY